MWLKGPSKRGRASTPVGDECGPCALWRLPSQGGLGIVEQVELFATGAASCIVRAEWAAPEAKRHGSVEEQLDVRRVRVAGNEEDELASLRRLLRDVADHAGELLIRGWERVDQASFRKKPPIVREGVFLGREEPTCAGWVVACCEWIERDGPETFHGSEDA